MQRGEKVALTSFQQEMDALGVVDLDTITAGQGMQQRCFSCNAAIGQSDENRVTPQTAGRKTIHPTNQVAKHVKRQPFYFWQASAVPVMVHSCGDMVKGHMCRAGGGPRGHVCHGTVSFRAYGHHGAMEAQPHPVSQGLCRAGFSPLLHLTQPAYKEKTQSTREVLQPAPKFQTSL